MNEDIQAIMAVLTLAELERLLKLPPGHRVERVDIANDMLRPGINVVISGPRLPFHGINDHLYRVTYQRAQDMLAVDPEGIDEGDG